MNELMNTDNNSTYVAYVDKPITVPEVVNNGINVFKELPEGFQMAVISFSLASVVGLTALAIIKGDDIRIGSLRMSKDFAQ